MLAYGIVAALLGLVFWFCSLPNFERTTFDGPFKHGESKLLGWTQTSTDDHIFVGLQALAKKYGRRFMITWPMRMVFISDPADIKCVLQTDNLRKSNIADKFRILTGDTLVSSNHYKSEQWKTFQAWFADSFKKGQIREFLPVFQQYCGLFVRHLTKESDQRVPIHISDWLGKVTLDITAHTMLGIELHVLNNPGTELVDALVGHMNAVGNFLNLIPGYVYWSLWKVRNSRKIIDKHIARIVKNRRARIATDGPEPGVFIDTLLEAKENGQPLTEQRITDQILMMLLAGMDTTKATLTTVMLLLARHPDVLKKLREEVAEYFRNPTPEALDGLKYLTNVIKETMRKHPSAPFLNREAPPEGYQLGDDFVPPGVPIVTAAILVHHDEELWPEPEKFNPDRFNDTIDPFTFLPFMQGPRICLGMHFFWAEAKLLVAHLVHNFDFEQPEEFKGPLKFDWRLISHARHPYLMLWPRQRV